MRSARLAWLGAALLVTALAGCSHSTDATAPAVAQPPPADSPAGAVRVVEWGFNHRDADLIGGILTDDFQFISASPDSAGNTNPGNPNTAFRRASFLAALHALLDSSSKVTLLIDKNLFQDPDTRPGKASKWHKQIRTSFDLNVRLDANDSFDVSGSALLFLTRGDSASIPNELADRGAKADSLHWWIDRWEDETLGRALMSPGAQRGVSWTLGALLQFFLSLFGR